MSGVDVVSSPRGADAGGDPGTSTCLSPDRDFPADLSALSLVELQVLHSRIARQLEREYLENPEGPHPVTRDRSGELVAELDARAAADS